MDADRLFLIDTHAHRCAPEFDHDLGAVLSRARAAGVAAVIAVGETLADAARTLELSPAATADPAGRRPVSHRNGSYRRSALCLPAC